MEKIDCSDPDLFTTTSKAIRDGFIEQALLKNEKCRPYIEQAYALSHLIDKIERSEQLPHLHEATHALLVAAGVSSKAEKHFSESDKRVAISEFVEKYLKPNEARFKDELVFRFLLHSGATFDGSMKNLVGKMAKSKLVARVVACLSLAHIECYWTNDYKKAKWNRIDFMNPPDAYSEKIKGLKWKNEANFHTLLFDTTPKCSKFNSNIDIVLLVCADDLKAAELLQTKGNYRLLGELKGGIDPAASDERWKTNIGHFGRLRIEFPDAYLAFVASAIHKKGARELCQMIKNKNLDYIANITKQEQLSNFCNWVVRNQFD